MNFKKSKNIVLPVFAFLFACIGLIFIYSASCYSATLEYNDAFFFVKKQGIALLVGIAAMITAKFLPLSWLYKGKWIILAVGVILLSLVLIPSVGVSSYGATRWISLGFTTFQPSEIAKFCLVIFLAGYFYDKPPTCLKNLWIPLSATGIYCGLVLAEPNMSITVVIGLSVLSLLFSCGISPKILCLLFVGVLVAGVVLIGIEPYRLLRLSAFLNPFSNPKGEGYQLLQSYYAVSSGGLFGVGLGNSRQKYLFLPFAESDFIFAIVCEETGLLGGMVLICLFVVFLLFCFGYAKRAENRYNAYLISGISSVIAIQVLVNLAVVTGCIPPTGVPLPFISYGGTSLVLFMFVTGLLSNASEVSKKHILA